MFTTGAKKYEREVVVELQMAQIAMEREFPDYEEAERHIERAKACIRYARQCNAGTFKGEDY